MGGVSYYLPGVVIASSLICCDEAGGGEGEEKDECGGGGAGVALPDDHRLSKQVQPRQRQQRHQGHQVDANQVQNETEKYYSKEFTSTCTDIFSFSLK